MTQQIKSPCIGQCQLNRIHDGFCLGCNRTFEEIKYWSAMTDKEREDIMKALPDR